MNAVVLRNTRSDNTSLMALSSILAVFPTSTLVYNDGSDAGITPRVNDLLNMFVRDDWYVHVIRSETSSHGHMFVQGVRLALALKAHRIFHFDEDVVVGLAWRREFTGKGIEAFQVAESTDAKGFRASPEGEQSFIGFAAFTAPAEVFTEEALRAALDNEGGPHEDVRFCLKLEHKPVVHKGYGVYHCTRDAGGSYIPHALRIIEDIG